MKHRLAAVSVTLALACAPGVRAQIRVPFPNAGPLPLLRLEGVLQASAAPKAEAAFTVASLGFLGDGAGSRRWLGVTRARTVGGDQPLDGKDVLQLVSPFDPNLLVTGAPAMVAQLRDAPAGTTVEVEGLFDRGGRTFYLRRVTVEKS
jgi:hypothetical protein